MAAEINKALITQFSGNVHTKAQQIKARLRPFVNIQQMSGDVFAYDGVGSVEAQEAAGRVQPVVFSELEHTRRKISKRRFVVTIPVDRMDVEGVLQDPEGIYSAACVRAIERKFDKVVTDAMFADVLTGRDFETTLTFAQDGGTVLDGTSSGVTYAKLLEAHQNFIDADVGNDMPESFAMGITGEEHTEMMNEDKLISGDYSRRFVVDAGQIVQATGINVVKFAADAPIPILHVTAGAVRECFVMSTRAMVVGISRNIQVNVQPRPDLVDTFQVQIIGVFGAVRTEGALIQKFNLTAT